MICSHGSLFDVHTYTSERMSVCKQLHFCIFTHKSAYKEKRTRKCEHFPVRLVGRKEDLHSSGNMNEERFHCMLILFNMVKLF